MHWFPLIALSAASVLGGAAHTVGWYLSYHRYGYPFNWRVLFGPNLYYRWLQRRELLK
jgi:hypothetical protein